MILERTLAEIEVLSDELAHRSFTPLEREAVHKDYADFCNFFESLSGIRKDAQLVFRKYHEARKAIKKRRMSDASVYIGEVAMDCKNLADNLNIFLQTIYGEYNGNLKSLKENTLNAPQISDGRTFYQLFTQIHDCSKESLVKNCRDSKGHVKGQTILEYSGKVPSGYRLYLGEPGNRKLGPDALEFLEEQTANYLQMAHMILETIADKDNQNFGARKSNRKLRTSIQRIKDYYRRHSKSAAIALASVLLTAGAVGGSIGTVAYQNYQTQKDFEEQIKKMNMIFDRKEKFQQNFDEWESCYFDSMEKEIIENRRTQLQGLLIGHPEYAPSYDLEKVFGANSNLFESIRGGLEIKSTRLGVYVDNNLAMAHIDAHNVTRKAREFLDRRKAYLENLQSFSVSTKGKVPTPAALETLDKLFHEEKALFKMETEIAEGFPHGRLK